MDSREIARQAREALSTALAAPAARQAPTIRRS
jgi:hypothetical protein